MSEAWQRKEGKDPKGGLNKKGVASYRAANPGSKLQTAVTTKPSKLKKGSKPAKRRKSFCARMEGMKSKLTSSKTANDPDSRINKSLRKWNCKDGGKIEKPRNYKKEYKKFQSSPSQIKKRTELNRINHEKETYGNGDGLDVSHVNGSVKLEPESTNRGRKEKSRMNGSKRKMANGGYAQFNPGDETITKKEARKKNYKKRVLEGMSKDALDENPMNRLDIRKIVKQAGKGKPSGYNELEQKKKAAKVAINKAKEKIAREKREYQEYVDSGQRKKDREAYKRDAKERIAKEKKEYQEYVSSGQRKKDRDAYKKKGKEEVKKASDKIKNRNKSKVTVDDLPITDAEKKRLSKKTNKTKPVKENNNMMTVKPITAEDFSKTANPKLKKKLDPMGTSGETEKQYQARLKKERTDKLTSFKPAKLKARDAESKPKKVKAKKIETKKVKKSLKEKIISKAEKVRAKISERMAENKKDREGMRQRRLANKRARKGLSTFDPETGRRIMQDGGMLKGPSHAKGGIAAKVGKQPIEMEGGEYVIKKSSAKKLGEDVLNYLNETGKVPQFMAGGYTKKMYMDGGMVEQEALEMGGKVQDNRAGFTPVYEHGGCVSMSDMNAGAGDVAHTHTHSGYKAGE